MATHSWNFTTRATWPVDTPTRTPIGWQQCCASCGWLPAPSPPSFYLPLVSYRRVSDGDLFLAASPSLALFSVAGREGWQEIEKWAESLCLHRGISLLRSEILQRKKMEKKKGAESSEHRTKQIHTFYILIFCVYAYTANLNWQFLTFGRKQFLL